MTEAMIQLAKLKAKEFVTIQSCGEWGDDLIEKDAIALASVILDFAKLYSTSKSGGSDER